MEPTQSGWVGQSGGCCAACISNSVRIAVPSVTAASGCPYMTIRVIINLVEVKFHMAGENFKSWSPMLAMQAIFQNWRSLKNIQGSIVQCDQTNPHMVPNDKYCREFLLASLENSWFPSLWINSCWAEWMLFMILLTSLCIGMHPRHFPNFYLAVWSSGMILA